MCQSTCKESDDFLLYFHNVTDKLFKKEPRDNPRLSLTKVNKGGFLHHSRTFQTLLICGKCTHHKVHIN